MVVLAVTLGLALPQVNSVWAQEDPQVKRLEELCEANNDIACFKLGERYRILERDNNTAEKYYLKACDTGHLDGCTFGGILVAKRGRSHFKEAAKLFAKGCDADQEMACYNLAALKFKEGRSSSAKKYYKKACDLGHPGGCARHKYMSK